MRIGRLAGVWMRLGIGACLIAGSACASYPKTGRLKQYDLAAGYRFERLPAGLRISDAGDNSDRLFVVLALSGGGTRAAALSYGVLRQLRDVTFFVNTKTGQPGCRKDEADCVQRTLLDEVDVISSVSGGSFTSAYYALHGNAIFDESGPFHQKFLYHPIQRDLFARAVYHPANWARLRSRPEIAANLYAEHVFGKATFADLKSRPRPYLVVNATDMSTGARFEFTQEQFDLLCADLESIPLARAVAASSAFPGLLNSMTIDSFNTNPTDGGCGYDGPGSHTAAQRASLAPLEKDWVDLALQSDRRSDRNFAAQQVLAYKDPRREHLHLLDGGLADNIGARAILQGVGTFDRPVKRVDGREIHGGWSALTLMNQRRTQAVLVVIVNAKTGRERDWDTKATGPGTGSVIDVSSGVPMGNFSRETLTRVRDLVRNAFPERGVDDAPRIYGVEVAFQDLPDEERKFFSNLGTNFDLDRYQVDCLIDRGGSLLRNARFMEPTDATFASFVGDELKSGAIGVPSKPSPACTPEEAERRVGVRNHYLDVGVSLGAALPGSNDVEDAKFTAGLAFRATRPHGWGVVVDLGPQTFPIVTPVDGSELVVGDLRLWSFMGGIAWTTIAGRAEATFGASAGIGLGSFEPSLAARDAYGRLGIFALEGDASNTWLLKPQTSLWYNLSDRWAATVSASYVFGRPEVRLASGSDTPFAKTVDAAAFRVGAGLGFRIF